MFALTFRPRSPKRSMRFPFVASFAILIGMSFNLSAQQSPRHIDDLIMRLEETRVQRDIPAVALTLVAPDSVLWSGTLGIADQASGRRADETTLFRIGSITKMFTALALLIAHEDGRLDLDAPATSIAPDLPMHNPWQNTHPVRVAHLLEHTAGLPDMSREEFDHNEPMELRAALAWKATERRALWPPGLHHSYSNVGPGLAAYVLERATGQRYEDFVQRRIFEPLGMRSAGFFADVRMLKNLATGYDADSATVIPYWHVLYRAFGAISALPSDLTPFIQMLLNRGVYRGVRLVSAAAIDRMETPRTTLAADSGLRYGYALGNYTWLRRGVLFHGHGGDGDGYLARLGYSRERGLGYFLVINVYRNGDLNRLRHLVEDFIAGDASNQAPPTYQVPAERLREYAGVYEAVTWRFPPAGASTVGRERIRIRVAGPGLRIDRGSADRSLIPVNDRHFHYADESVATTAFISYEGRIYFQDDDGNYVKIEEDVDSRRNTGTSSPAP